MRNLGFLVVLGVGIYSQRYLDQLLERERETAPTDWELDGRPSVWFRKTGNRRAERGWPAWRLLLSTPSWIKGDAFARSLQLRYRLLSWLAICAFLGAVFAAAR
jgi:hypothetical protein